MTDPDCVETYQELAAMLQNFQLGWVVEQVEASLSQDFSGHTEESPLPVATNSPQAVLTKPMTNTAQARLLKSDTPSKAGGLMSVTAPRAGELH
jgi:hypothetical protein